MKRILLLTVFAAITCGAGGAWANGPFPNQLTDGSYGPVGSVTPNSNTGEYEIYQAVNLLLGTSYTNNAAIGSLQDTGNTSTWSQTGNGGYTVIGLGAGNSNAINVYNAATPNVLINPLGGFSGNGATGNGTVASPYPGTAAVFASGTQFGFALTSTSASNTLTWYSDPSLNSDGIDHMLAYNLPSLAGTSITINENGNIKTVVLNDPYLLGFEDTSEGPGGASDMDYNDLMVLVDGVGVAPVPEPVTMALFAFGLLAMAGFALRQNNPGWPVLYKLAAMA